MKDLKNRVKNMAWTTSHKDVEVDVKGVNSYTNTSKITVADSECLVKLGVSEDNAEKVVLLAAGHEGAHVKYSDMSALNGVYERNESKADMETLGDLCQITEDYRVDTLAAKERPGYWDMRRASLDGVKQLFDDDPSHAKNPLLKAVSFYTNGLDYRAMGKKWKEAIDYKEVKDIAERVMEIAKTAETTEDAVRGVEDYYYERFHKEMPKFGKSDKKDDNESDEEDDGRGEPKDGEDGEHMKDADSPSSAKEPDGDGENDVEDGEPGEGRGDKEGEEENECEDDGETEEDATEEDDVATEEDATEEDSTDGEDADEDGGADSEDGETDSSGGASGGEGDGDAEENDDVSASEDTPKAMPKKEFLKSATKDTLHELLDTPKLEKERERTKSTAEDLERDKHFAKSDRNCILNERDYRLLYTEQETEAVENAICTGVHSGANIMYAERNTESVAMVPSYDKATLDGQAAQVSNVLREHMKAASEIDSDTYYDGDVVDGSVCWRPDKIHSYDIFLREKNTDVGGFVVDLLLDASGSQGYRTSDIQKQSYVIARACSLAGIPCRVTSFDNSTSFTILEVLRNYDDPQEKDSNCFRYLARGDNRDGLAIMAANVELQKRSEPHKILLVLSDGLPLDNGHSRITRAGGTSKYIGLTYDRSPAKINRARDVISDVYNVVRKIRTSGTAVLGIYVGDSGYTELEKAMYGNDFAYIKDMHTFVPVISTYLKKSIMEVANKG